MITEVISEEQASKMIEQRGEVVTMANNDTGEYAFISGYGVPKGYDPKEWIPCSTTIPLEVTPREGLENGVIETIEDYKLVFHKDGTLLQLSDPAVRNKNIVAKLSQLPRSYQYITKSVSEDGSDQSMDLIEHFVDLIREGETKRIMQLNDLISDSIQELAELDKWANLQAIAQHAVEANIEVCERFLQIKESDSLFDYIEHSKAILWFMKLHGRDRLRIYREFNGKELDEYQ